MLDLDFWHGRRVLITGHTGFKGAWLTLWLRGLGARVIGFADAVPTTPSLYALADAGRGIQDIRGDIRDHAAVLQAVAEHAPEIVIHMAAQALVRPSFDDPRTTFETNVMGTVNVLEAVRVSPSVRAVVNVTSDKCYDNAPGREPRPFVEGDPKGGHDPYSSSKACAELVADAYLRSYLRADPHGPRLGSARAGNVIGGGDWGRDRLIPDLMQGALAGGPIAIRSPDAIRPWQHVLNPLAGYLCLAQALCDDPRNQGGWNFGPGVDDAQPVRWIADRLSELWPTELIWDLDERPHVHEANMLTLDSSMAQAQLGWSPVWGLEQSLATIVDWYQALRAGGDMRAVTLAQIDDFQQSASPSS